MDTATYHTMVTELEAQAASDPERMRSRVYGLIATGYAYVGFALLLVLGSTLGLIAVLVATGKVVLLYKPLIALVVVAGVILKALWIQIDPPAGIILERAEAPTLFRRVEEIRTALRAPRPHNILLTEDLNASVTQVPLLGLFGWPRTYLVLGLPLMLALSPEEFDAVLAHEFGHLSGSHPKRGLWVHRMGATWAHLMSQMEQRQSWGRLLFDPFLSWYVPRLNAYGFVMSRRDEYSADADAARVTSADAMARALLRLATTAREYPEGVWRRIWMAADVQPEPPERAWSEVPQMLREVVTAPAQTGVIAAALSAAAHPNDTHPALRERLASLGVHAAADGNPEALASILTPPTESAADKYLGATAEARLRELDQEWRAASASAWRKRHGEKRARRARLDELRSAEARGAADAAGLLQLADLLGEFENEEAAVPLLRRVLAVDEPNAGAHFLLGRALLSKGDAEGIPHLRRAMEIDPQAIEAGAGLLYEHFARANEESSIEELRSFRLALLRRVMEDREDRSRVVASDNFVAPELSPADRIEVIKAAARLEDISEIWVARKITRHRMERALHIMVVERNWRVRIFGSEGAPVTQALLNSLIRPLETDVIVLQADLEASALVEQIKRVGARLERGGGRIAER